MRTIVRKGGTLKNVEFATENILVKSIKREEFSKVVFLVFEEDFIQVKREYDEDDACVTACSEEATIDTDLYDELIGDIKLIYISPENDGLIGIIDDIEDFMKTKLKYYEEIYIIGKGIGGVFASIIPEIYPRPVRLITVGTPYHGIKPTFVLRKKKAISKKNEILHEMLFEDFFEVADFSSLENVAHINCVTGNIKKENYIITTESQNLPKKYFTKGVIFDNMTEDMILKEALKMLPERLRNVKITIEI